MQTAKLFKSGRSQAVRLPRAFRLEGTEVAVKHVGTSVLLIPLQAGWELLEESLEDFEPGTRIERNQPRSQERKALKP